MKNNSDKTNHEKSFLNTFQSLCSTRTSWQVWSDFVFATACSIANSTYRDEKFEKRKKEYSECIKRLGGVDKCAELFKCVVMALEENPCQDFLGKLYMDLNLGNHWKGQFFTPYNVCYMMSKMTLASADSCIDSKGYVSIHDPACGAGATLIAAANTLKEKGINYQRKALFVAQDVDRIVGLMCYIQLSLLGCAGYVVIGDSLLHPLVGKDELSVVSTENHEIWYMPAFNILDVWLLRREMIRYNNIKG